MFQSPQNEFDIASNYKGFSRVVWIGSKVAESIGIEVERQADIYSNMWTRLLGDDLSNATPVENEAALLATQLVALATVAERTAAIKGPSAALARIMRESGKSIDPLLATNFLRLASSPVFWMALESVGSEPVD